MLGGLHKELKYHEWEDSLLRRPSEKKYHDFWGRVGRRPEEGEAKMKMEALEQRMGSVAAIAHGNAERQYGIPLVAD